MERAYPIRAASKITGLSIDLLRAWERRYRAVVPERNGRGRQYSQADLDRLILLKKLVDRGHSIGSVGSLDAPALEKLLGEATPAGAQAELTQNILAAIENYDSYSAERELRRLAALLMPRDMVFQVILPLMRTVGERWHGGQLRIAQEHMVSAMVRNVLAGMLHVEAAPAKVILATPEGELHELGILAGAMIVALSGLQPVYLGPNLPFEEILHAAKKTGARAIAMGVTMESEEIRQQIWWLRLGLPRGMELWMGGAGANGIDLSVPGPDSVVIKDLNELEAECRRLRDML
jgi:methanogenic corrinoid protein MtbC1